VSIVLLLLVMRRIAMRGREDPSASTAGSLACTDLVSPAP
jgi:hypothetical protein